MVYPLRPLLVVEDSAEDFTALSRVFRKLGVPNPVVRCEDGDQALAYLQGHGQAAGWPATLPALVLLDLNLPGTDGRTVLETLKRDPRLQALPVCSAPRAAPATWSTVTSWAPTATSPSPFSTPPWRPSCA